MNYIEQQILEGNAVLFLGAGASYNCKNISGTRIGFTGGELLSKINERFLDNQFEDVNLDVAATMAIQIAGRTELDHFLRDLVYDFEPTEEHDLITKFKWKAIFTTNYDEVIEKVYLNNRKETCQKIEKIICDNDPLSKAYVSPDKLPLIKIHGCISRLNDNSLPLIISRSDYRMHMTNRSGLFQSLKETLCNDLVIFYGYGLSDYNIIGLLDDLEREGKSRTRHVWLDPYMGNLHEKFWQSKNLDCKKTSLTIFLNQVSEKKNKFSSVTSVLKKDSCISKLIPSHNRPSEKLEEYLKKQLIYTDQNSDRQIEIDNYNVDLFYRGSSIGFGWTGKNLDFKRAIFNTLSEEIFINSELTNKVFNFYLINGYAGSGKTVLLKRLAWEGVQSQSKPCFYLTEGSELNVDLIIELIQLIKETIFIFVDDILSFQDEIYKLSNFSEKNASKLFIIGTTRTNEWNNSTNTLDSYDPITFSLYDLNDLEIKSLISKLKEFHVEGNLKDLSENEKFKFIKESSNKQLLVTLLEATHHGKEFAEIIKDEYECIYDRTAKELYLNICTLHRHKIELRAGMIKRLSGIDFENFRTMFLLPLELLVVTYFSHKNNDYVYSSRHQNIAENVYSQAFLSEIEKAQQLIKIIRYLNISYESDKKALEILLKGKLLATEFNDKSLVESIYNIADDIGLNHSYLLHQKAIFEINHNQGNLNLALEYIKKIDTTDSFYDMKIVNHTRANIYRKLALQSTSTKDKKVYRNLGWQILNKIIRTSHNNSIPYVTKGYLFLDEISELSENDNLIVEIIKEFESNLSSGYKKFPYDESLLALEHDFSLKIDTLPKTILKLEEALRKNSDNIFLLKRYAKYHISKGDFTTARNAMSNFLRNHINDKDINFLMAESYLKEDEKNHIDIALKYLRKSYSTNDNSFYEKIMHARLEYIHKSEDKAYSIFQELSKSYLPAKIKNKARYPILDDTNKEKVYDAYIVTINPDYGFVKCYDYNENIFVHKSSISDQDTWDLLRPNDALKITIQFNFRGPIVNQLTVL